MDTKSIFYINLTSICNDKSNLFQVLGIEIGSHILYNFQDRHVIVKNSLFAISKIDQEFKSTKLSKNFEHIQIISWCKYRFSICRVFTIFIFSLALEKILSHLSKFVLYLLCVVADPKVVNVAFIIQDTFKKFDLLLHSNSFMDIIWVTTSHICI